jgi:signal transduction histidine kinase
VTIVVKDTGCGIQPELILKVYEPFYTTKPDGTGLGLSIVKTIIENHKGILTIQSEPGQGTDVIIKLPVNH